MENRVERLELVRHPNRPNARFYIDYLFPDFIEMSGDRLFGDDPSVIAGISSIAGYPITVIGQQKGRTMEENLACNFSMNKPEGYRKALRLMKQAEKFHRPVLCFVDTVGAYPGKEAEERGQSSAIANNLMEMMNLRTPVISILIGDGGSGGALAFCVSDVFIALENSLLSVISPKACANILWKDSSRQAEAFQMLKMTANDLENFKIIDSVVSEPGDGAHTNPEQMAEELGKTLVKNIKKLSGVSVKKLVHRRNRKYRRIGCEMQ